MITWTVECNGNGVSVGFKLVVDCRRCFGTWRDGTLSFDDVLCMVEFAKDKLLASLKPDMYSIGGKLVLDDLKEDDV